MADEVPDTEARISSGPEPGPRDAELLSSPLSSLVVPSFADVDDDGGADAVALWRRAVIGEAYEVELTADIWSSIYRNRAGVFQNVSTYLALASGIVAIFAGGSGLTVSAELGALVSLGAAVLAVISSTIGASARTDRERAAAVANTALADSARVFGTTVAKFYSRDETLSAFRALLRQRDGVVRNAPIEGVRTIKKMDKMLHAAKKDPPSRPRPPAEPE